MEIKADVPPRDGLRWKSFVLHARARYVFRVCPERILRTVYLTIIVYATIAHNTDGYHQVF